MNDVTYRAILHVHPTANSYEPRMTIVRTSGRYTDYKTVPEDKSIVDNTEAIKKLFRSK